MKSIDIEGTDTIPRVKFDPKHGKLEIRGRSVPENSREFYKPLLDSLDQYAVNPCVLTQIDIQLDYFNTTSSKCLLDLFRRIKDIHSRGNQVIVNWYCRHDDEDILEAGEDYELIVGMKFNMVQT